MAIELPRFEDTFCQFINLCSRIAEEPPGGLPATDLDLTSSYNATTGKALIRLLWDRDEKHFHIDVALRSAFGKKPPKTDTRLPQLRKVFDLFRGATVNTVVQGSYVIPITSLPPTGGLIFTGNTAIKLKVSKSEIELTGASLTFRNAEVNHIRWDLGKDTVFLEVFARRTGSVNDIYMRDALHSLNASVDRYILGKKGDDKTA
jgi:hypothetical protein